MERLPLLKRTLEDKYGSALDEWLTNGRFSEARWAAAIKIDTITDRLTDLVREAVREAVRKEELSLSLPSGESWTPIQVNGLLDSVYEQCQEAFTRFYVALLNAIKNAPTREAERELIEVMSGKKRVSKRYVREDALSVVVLTEGNPLTLQAKVLIDLRYRADGGRSLYAEAQEGEISSVWREIVESLPEEVIRLICEDGSF
ncbi:MAG TPA: hypothetical protein VN256_23030 [Pyrinomonadaceae bacterium]|nr:hypothetical protein [Pyrinomonadaceae bacterium]